MKKINKIILGLFLGLLIIGAGCATQNSTQIVPKDTSPIKIGFVGPLTGDVANIGNVVKAATEVAVNEVNANGGINSRKLEVIYEDGFCDSKNANLAGNKLINIDKVPVIIGGICSGESLAVVPTAEINKVVMLSPASTNPKLTTAGDYFFRLIPSDSFQGRFVADYVANKLGKKKVAILYATDREWSVGIKEEFKKRFVELGGSVVDEEGVADSSRDLRGEITKIKAANPDLIYFPSHVGLGIVGLKQLKDMGVTVPILGGDVWDDPTMPGKVGPGAEGVRYTVTASAKLPDAFLKSVKVITGNDEMNAYAPRAYDAVKIFAEIMNRVGVDSEKIKNELYNLKDYKGLADTYSFDQNGDVVNAAYDIKEFKNGKIVTVN